MKKQKFHCGDDEKVEAYQKSGHIWQEEDGYVDVFVLDNNLHNGPKCVKCGYNPCWYCEPVPKKCTIKNKEYKEGLLC